MTLCSILLLAAVTAAPAADPGAGPVEEGKMLGPGDPAPPFALVGSDGKTHSLADHAGKRAVVIAWFPKAFTGG